MHFKSIDLFRKNSFTSFSESIRDNFQSISTNIYETVHISFKQAIFEKLGLPQFTNRINNKQNKNTINEKLKVSFLSLFY